MSVWIFSNYYTTRRLRQSTIPGLLYKTFHRVVRVVVVVAYLRVRASVAPTLPCRGCVNIEWLSIYYTTRRLIQPIIPGLLHKTFHKVVRVVVVVLVACLRVRASVGPPHCHAEGVHRIITGLLESHISSCTAVREFPRHTSWQIDGILKQLVNQELRRQLTRTDHPQQQQQNAKCLAAARVRDNKEMMGCK